jgi:hypothetical protein
MRKTIFILLIQCLWAAIVISQPSNHYWQQQVNYKIDVTLNDTANTLSGFVDIEYINQSPDTLSFLWIHLWPNAYKNDKTAFSEQSLTAGQTQFYFSKNEEKGYINRLDFKTAGNTLLIEDHPLYIDVVKMILSEPLAPGHTTNIKTPFHVKLPYLFSRMGHVEQHYVIAQWYPKVAVYDKQGWHPMPYLEWGEFYNDFGNYDVQITLPANYVVGATGTLQNSAEKEWLKKRTKPVEIPQIVSKKKELFTTQKKQPEFPTSANKYKTISYKATNVTDFAWMADKRFLVKYDTIQLTNQTVEAWNYYLPADAENWQNSMKFTKKAIRFYSEELGEYPYPQVSVAANPLSEYDGMEYPMITTLNATAKNEQLLDVLITHEIGHNWLMEILATNERQHAWMDEGINTFYERKYLRRYYSELPSTATGFFAKKMPADNWQAKLDRGISAHTDQPIETPVEQLTLANYQAAVYNKTALLMEKMEAQLGKDSLRKIMRNYYAVWKFKHPQPADFETLAQNETTQPLQPYFNLLTKTGPLETSTKKPTRLTAFFDLRNTAQASYIGLAPAIGYNNYDKFEIGLLAHNYNNPSKPLQFVFAPMLGTGSKKLIGLGRLGYTWHPQKHFQKVEIYASAARFSYRDAADLKDSSGANISPIAFSKLVPGVYIEWKNKSPLSTVRKWIDFRTFIINEKSYAFKSYLNPIDSAVPIYATKGLSQKTVIPQLTMGWANERNLYPWSVELGVQQVKQIVRSTITAKYFLNYNEKGQGMSVRLFFGKIFYTQEKTLSLRSKNSRYHFIMYGPNIDQDYTYANAFAERNQSTGVLGRQILLRDAAFKYRTDYGGGSPGLSFEEKDYYFDNWISSLNLTLDIPNKINPLAVLPIKVPLKIFADFATSNGPWKQNSAQPKFLYSIGFQLPILKFINLYYPIIQSSQFKQPIDYNGGGDQAKWWQKRLTFTVDINELKGKAKSMFVL